jgi:excisionase family DNA binding protein
VTEVTEVDAKSHEVYTKSQTRPNAHCFLQRAFYFCASGCGQSTAQNSLTERKKEIPMPATIETKQTEPTREGLASVTQACKFLAISRTSLYKLMSDGQLKFIKLPGLAARRIAWRALRNLVEGE